MPASTTTTKPKRGEGAALTAHADMLAIVLATLLAGTVLLMTMLAVINL